MNVPTLGETNDNRLKRRAITISVKKRSCFKRLANELEMATLPHKENQNMPFVWSKRFDLSSISLNCHKATSHSFGSFFGRAAAARLRPVQLICYIIVQLQLKFSEVKIRWPVSEFPNFHSDHDSNRLRIDKFQISIPDVAVMQLIWRIWISNSKEQIY